MSGASHPRTRAVAPIAIAAVALIAVGVVVGRRATRGGDGPRKVLGEPKTLDEERDADKQRVAHVVVGRLAGDAGLLLEEAALPEAKSAAPTDEEWKSARAVTLAWSSSDACAALLVREWLRVRCDDGNFGSATLLAGPAEDVTATQPASSSAVELTLPLRRGDRRVLQLNRLEFQEYGGGQSGQLPWHTLSETWLDDSPGPVISLD